MKIPPKMKTAILMSLRKHGYEILKADGKQNLNIAEASNYDLETIRLASQISMQSTQRIWALIGATKYVVNNGIRGHFVECGVYKGSSALIIARTLKSMNIDNRHIYLYDTFEGMTKPTDLDRKQGTQTLASDMLASTPMSNGENVWAWASLENVTQMLNTLDYPLENFHLIKGDVLETLSGNLPESVCLLRLDTDWYESTKKELEALYPRVATGGVVIIDDYGHWSGSKLAVDQFLRDNELFPLLNYLDYAGRLWVKQL